MKANIKKTLFRKYVSAFFLFFLIPFSVLTLFLNLSLYNNLQKEIDSYNRNILDQASVTVWNIFYEVLELANGMRFDGTLRQDTDIPSVRVKIINELAKRNQDNGSISQINLFYPDSELAFSSRGTYKTKILAGNIIGGNEKEAEAFLSKISAVNAPGFRKIDVQYHVKEKVVIQSKLLYIYPLLDYNNKIFAHAVYEINQAKIIKALSNNTSDFSDGMFISNYGMEDLVASSQVKDAYTYMEEIKDEVKLDNKEGRIKITNFTSALYTVLPNSDLVIFNIVDRSAALSGFLKKNIILLVSFSILAVVGYIMSVFIGRRYYRPIQQLLQYVSSGDEIKGQTNELLFIRQQFDKVNEMRMALAKELEKKMPLVEEHLVTGLLYQNIYDNKKEDVIHTMIEKQISGKYYRVVSITQKGSNNNIQKVYFENLNFIRELFGTDYLVYSSFLYYYEAIAIIFIFDKEPDENAEKLISKKIIEFFLKKYNYKIIIGFGNIYNKEEDIHTSFLESITSMRQQQINPNFPIRLKMEDEKFLYKKGSIYQTEYIIELNQCIKTGDSTKIDKIIEEIIINLEQMEVPSYILSMVCYDIINNIIKSVNKTDISVSETDIFELTNFKTIQEFGNKFKELLHVICQDVKQSIKENKNELEKRVEKYIDENFTDSEISLVKMADDFKFSPSYLSKFITCNFNSSFSDIITAKRMEYIKDKLQTTDNPVTQIAQESGYSNISNFMRRFKGIEGVTPGQYRLMYSQSNHFQR